ncbi:class I SAM-dependent DNA methyltransferase [Variovorax sp. 770b2]|uniref:type I restriction-modification system subunit M n=1 Tax=Variovorax sp. 770b2 TaxID=1566271 RepID=UPI0008E3E073|nr:class I SAM-dependent DNA methyltransferase [Variovorax sp. 770b2]SFQ34200.1 type I restriction enzyme M protein [Variovorax sp. 770b2]
MSKPVNIQHVFDEVVAQIEALTRPSTKVEDDAAVAKLQELAADLQKSHPAAAENIGLIAHFPQAQDGWEATQRHNLGRYVKDRLPRLRESLALPRPNVADLIWRSAELLRGAFREPEYRRVILPFTVLRRLDCLLQPTKSAVVAKHGEISTKNYDLRMFLAPITGYPFWNHSPFTLKGLTDAPDSLRDNLDAMVNGFSPNVRKIFEKFSFMATVDKLQEKGRLFHIVQAFARMPMDTYSVTAHDMGKAFEELLRRFNETSPAGEQYTPRDVIHLMTSILFDGDDEALSVPGVIRTMYDQTAGTGGMLSEGEEKFRSFNTNARLRLFGQELEDETYAICMADMLIRDQDPADIAVGDTLAEDKHPDERFDYQLSNPPYGVEWKPAQEAVEREHAKGAAGRFGPGLPRISDGQMLFQLNSLSKMRPFIDGEGGGKIGLVHNGSPLFTGDAGSGESEIRRHILEHDYLEAIVAMPTDMFYNTNIATYLWFMSNRKPAERKGKVLLIDASQMGVLMKKNLGKKRFELSDDCQSRIAQAFHDFETAKWNDRGVTSGRKRALKTKVLDNAHFFYRKVTIERPQRMRFDVTEERLLAFIHDSGYSKLKDGGELMATLNQALGDEPARSWKNAEQFRADLQTAHDEMDETAEIKPSTLKAKQFEVARKFFGIRDKAADITTNEKGEVISDADLRDSEYIPFSVLGNDVEAGIAAYFEREVIPHWPDAWVNKTVRDSADGQIGLVGCEMNFNREFYVYEAPRSRDAIRHEIEVMEKQFIQMLKGVTQ